MSLLGLLLWCYFLTMSNSQTCTYHHNGPVGIRGKFLKGLPGKCFGRHSNRCHEGGRFCRFHSVYDETCVCLKPNQKVDVIILIDTSFYTTNIWKRHFLKFVYVWNDHIEPRLGGPNGMNISFVVYNQNGVDYSGKNPYLYYFSRNEINVLPKRFRKNTGGDFCSGYRKASELAAKGTNPTKLLISIQFGPPKDSWCLDSKRQTFKFKSSFHKVAAFLYIDPNHINTTLLELTHGRFDHCVYVIDARSHFFGNIEDTYKNLLTSSGRPVLRWLFGGITDYLCTFANTNSPTIEPTSYPTVLTKNPSVTPTVEPTPEPTYNPSINPSANPVPRLVTKHPTMEPTDFPTNEPTKNPAY